MTDTIDPTDGASGAPGRDTDDEGRQIPDPHRTRPGTALCLSGGGYRAMLFHLGCIIRLNELGHLRGLARVSSVSGGSITAGALGLAWGKLRWDDHDVATNLDDEMISPVLKMAGKTIDVPSIFGGALLPFRTISDQVRRSYDRHLFDGATLADLPADGAGPRVVINATNVQTGKLFRFSRPYIADYTIGLWRDPETRISDAVCASSAFPPVLSPHTIEPSGTLDPTTVGPNAGEEFTTKIWLSDGGVYDNLGLETSLNFDTILVSDGGGMLGTQPSPKRDWARHGVRVSQIVDGQVRALRKRQLIDLYQRGFRRGTYWGMRSDVASYGIADPITMPDDQRDNARTVPTRLAKLDKQTKHDLVNWGYVIADTAIRRYVAPDAPRPTSLPY